ncbi:RNA polymerase sigma factor [Enterococcus saccharolyticus]|uniref:RNA polymerase sigma factor n=1 Tax=Enterococcus saccharolyticus TaxID=41997 RepID=UPI001E33B2C6|nr:RNA polymerase sigma factor [Enterococcus saccharolyticus]MCD5000865.1 RNA polymerase sigma factor [Enterococcus saccharolyticus]
MRAIKDYFIILKIKAGDTDAWEELVNKYYESIFHYCRRRFFGNESLAEDLTQEIFLKVIRSIDSYRFTGKFFNYLFTIAVNTCNDFSQKKKLDEVALENIEQIATNSFDTEKWLVEELQDTIQFALNQLSQQQREAILLKFYYGMKVKEIAAITDTSIPTTQSRINQGLTKMKRLLNKEDIYFD